jgi:hypothetical protein
LCDFVLAARGYDISGTVNGKALDYMRTTVLKIFSDFLIRLDTSQSVSVLLNSAHPGWLMSRWLVCITGGGIKAGGRKGRESCSADAL